MHDRSATSAWHVLVWAVCLIGCPLLAWSCGPDLRLEKDWMAGYEPSCGAFKDAFKKCGYSNPAIHEDDGNCTYSQYAVNCQPDLPTYLINWQNDPKPGTFHQVHILGSNLYDQNGTYDGMSWVVSCCESVATVCVGQCPGGSGGAWEKCVSNHEIGHEFGCGHCTNNQCVMYDQGPTTPVDFCTTGLKHCNYVATHDP